MLSSDDILKDQIESEIKRDAQEGVDLKSATEILGLTSIDKEYKALKKRTADTQFKFSTAKSGQKLRPYQEEAIANLERFIKDKEETIAVQLPTGAGKTFFVHSFIHKNLLKKSKNVLIVTPSWEIANQHAMTMCQQFKDGESRVRRLGGNGQLISAFEEFRPGMKGKVIITTTSLFFARQEVLRQKLKCSLVVVDEGHHGWKKKRINSIETFARENGIPTVLLTATPPRNMENLPFAAQLRYLDLVPEYLVKCQVVRLDTGEEFDPVFKNGILVQTSRIEISSRSTRYEKIVEDSIEHMKGQTIYYAGSVREAMGVLKEYEKRNIKATVVHSKWASKGDKINALAIEQFRLGKVQVLVNVQMLAMGFDVPTVETIIVARPVESDTLFTQMVGRGARPAEGKEKFILIDVHDTIFKPEVAKIFEHKELFYAGTNEPDVAQKLPPPAPGRVLTFVPGGKLPLREWHSEIPSAVVDFDAFEYLTLRGSNTAVNFLIRAA